MDAISWNNGLLIKMSTVKVLYLFSIFRLSKQMFGKRIGENRARYSLTARVASNRKLTPVYGNSWENAPRRGAPPGGDGGRPSAEMGSVRRSVSRVLWPGRPGRRPFIWGVRRRTPLATNPNGGSKTRPSLTSRRSSTWDSAVPIRSCSRWGLPCRPRFRGRGALLPHPFTLTFPANRESAVCFLWHFP